MTLTKVASMEAESVRMFEQAEQVMDEISNEVSQQRQEANNLQFNMLLNYAFMLNDYTNVDASKRQSLIAKLQDNTHSNGHNMLFKKALISIQQIFTQEDPSALLPEFEALHEEITQPGSGIPNPSYIQIMLKYFISNLYVRNGDMEGAVQMANQMLNKDIPTYFGHLENDISIEPMLIILNQKFDTLTQMQLT